MDTVLQDVKYALRNLASSPGFLATAILSLALGIGANTAIFTLTNAVFLHPLPVADPARIMDVFTVDHSTVAATNLGRTGISWLNFVDIRDQNQVFSGAAAFTFASVTMTGRGTPNQQLAQLATSNYFDLLGVKLFLGRTFFADEDQKPTPVAILSYSLWQKSFGGDSSIINRVVELNSIAYTIIGVAPPDFKGTFSIGSPDVIWIPMSMHSSALGGAAEQYFPKRRFRILNVFGRLKAGMSEQQALANLKTLAAQLEREYPEANRGRTFEISSLSEAALGGQRDQTIRVTLALSVVVGLVLLIACVNLANLLLARSAKRAREMSIRSALGAGRVRIIRQLLTESLILAAAGGIGGLLVGWAGCRVLWSLRPVGMDPRGLPLSIDINVFAFTAGIALFTGLLFGLAPAIRASAPDLNSILKTGGRGGTEHWVRNRVRSLLVVSQIGLAMVALIGAGLFIRSMRRAENVEPGYETKSLFVFGFDLSSRQYSEQRGREFLHLVIEQAASTPGVRSVALASAPPPYGALLGTTYPEGQDDPLKARGILVSYNTVSPNYFDTIRVRLQEGRLFTAFDRQGARKVAIVGASTARLLWPGQDAIGRRFRLAIESSYWEVIGVVSDISAIGSGEAPPLTAYLPLDQNYESSATVVARAEGNPATALKTAVSNVQRLDPNLALVGAFTMNELIAQGLWAPRTGAALFSIFGLLALGLAAIGIYGVMAYMVTQRTNEIGIRMALGARPGDVLLLVAGHGARLALAGIGLGVVAGLALTRLIAGLLFGVGARDPLTFVIVSVTLAAAALLATLLPARFATRIDPVLALRQE